MNQKEVLQAFHTKICEYLLSLPFDLKVLQEAVSDPDLERQAREMAAGVLIHALLPHEGSGYESFLEDVFQVRLVLDHLRQHGGDGAVAFINRFSDVYETLDGDLDLFAKALSPDLWLWLKGRTVGFKRLVLKGKRAATYVDDETTWDSLYEDGVDLQTNYTLTDAMLRNKLKRPEQIFEPLQRRHQDDLKKRS